LPELAAWSLKLQPQAGGLQHKSTKTMAPRAANGFASVL
jgi:hypothetical protein